MKEDEINEEVTKNDNTEDARIVGDGEKIEDGEELETVVKIGEVLPSQKRRTITGRYVLKLDIDYEQLVVLKHNIQSDILDFEKNEDVLKEIFHDMLNSLRKN